MLNALSMTAFLIGLGLAGKSTMAAEVGIVQGATLALFYTFSANARNIILNPSSRISVQSMVRARLLLSVPLGIVAFYLSVYLTDVGGVLASVLILRRCAEWIAELHLTELELHGDRKSATRFVVLQAILLFLVLGWTLGGVPLPVLGLLLWGASPVVLGLSFLRQQLKAVKARSSSEDAWVQMLPHLGSTAMIGITVYVFRLLILFIVGKETAGDLYAAFAIGGVAGSVFASGVGPSLVLHEAHLGEGYFPHIMKMVLGLWFVGGATLFLSSRFWFEALRWTNKSDLFWGAVGLSMIGGVVMVFGQRIRLRLLQLYDDRDVYGPDLLSNVIVLVSIPYLYYVLGKDALMALYLVSAIVGLLFYASARSGLSLNARSFAISQDKVRMVVPLLLFFPLFFQLTGQIFQDRAFIFDSQGALMRVPLPVSLLACFVGIPLLGRYGRASLSLGVIFLSFVLMLMSVVITTHARVTQQEAKLILMLQFLVPMCALVLGQLYEEEGANRFLVEKAFLYVLLALVPVQLLLTWVQGYFVLSPYLYLFSIYQHLQYVPVIFAGGYLIALYSLWDLARYRKALIVLAPLMGIYVSGSGSMVAMAALIGGMLGFALYRWKVGFDRSLKIAVLLMMVSSGSYFKLARSNMDALRIGEKFDIAGVEMLRAAVATRLHYWRYYTERIGDSSKELLFGHSERLDRSKYPSAHNYYLNFVYNFGLLAVLPLLSGIGYTVWMLYRCRKTIVASSSFLGLAIVVLIVLFVDNSLKVGLGQPYPGIISFFLWGILLSRLYRASVMGQQPEKAFL
jgi:hypothetical protein